MQPITSMKTALYLIIISLSIFSVNAQPAPDCDEDIAQSMFFKENLFPFLDQLGDFPNDPNEQQKIVSKYFSDDEAQRVRQLVKKYKKWRDSPVATERTPRSVCFQDITDISLAQVRWLGYFTQAKSRSDSYPAGYGWTVEINNGVGDLGKNSEVFAAGLRILPFYTFTKKEEKTGGWFRLKAGYTSMYQATEFNGFVTFRPELRIADFPTIAAIKLNLEYDLGLDDINHMAGFGLALELEWVSINLMYLRPSDFTDNIIQFGVNYRHTYFRSKS